MKPAHRALMLLGWAVLVAGPAVAWVLARSDDAGFAVAYGEGPPSRWLAAAGAGVPSAALAALLLLNGALRARAAAGRAGVSLGGPDRALVAASRTVGWLLVALLGLLLAAAMVALGPIGMIGGFALLLGGFSLVGRGATARNATARNATARNATARNATPPTATAPTASNGGRPRRDPPPPP